MKKKKSSSEKIKDSELEKKITEFLKHNIRPYNLQEILISFKNKYSKTQVNKILTDLIKKNKIIGKNYGKSLIYLGIQNLKNLNEEELKNLNEEIEELKRENLELKNIFKNLEMELKKIKEVPNDEEVLKRIKEYRDFIMTAEEKLKSNDEMEDVDENQITEIKIKHSKLKKIMNQRISVFKNIVDTIREGLGYSKKQLYDEIGIEYK